MEINEVTDKIIGAAITVHRQLGPGLLESAYEACLAIELRKFKLQYERQLALPLFYDGQAIDCGYRIDFLVEGLVVVEVKAVIALDPIFTAQLLTYLKLTDCSVGLLVNFNVALLPSGIKRVVHRYAGALPRAPRFRGE